MNAASLSSSIIAALYPQRDSALESAATVFSFTTGALLLSLRAVRALLGFILLFIAANTAVGQQQERGLMERLLKPDTTLASPDQHKQFALRGTTTTKAARTKWFFTGSRPREKQFATTMSTVSKPFHTSVSSEGKHAANLSTRAASSPTVKQYPVRDYAAAPPVTGGGRMFPTSSSYDSTRPFLVRGKSQKALSAQDKPLSIEDVRELLNKNK